VAYLPGLTMRRIADLYPGEAKTDARDAHIIADAARTMPHTPHPVRRTALAIAMRFNAKGTQSGHDHSRARSREQAARTQPQRPARRSASWE
jgi:hypothetical protein